MEKVLPCVEDRNSDEELKPRNNELVHNLGREELPRRKASSFGLGRDERRVVSACQCTGEEWMRAQHILRDGRSVQPKQPQERGQTALGEANARRPHGNVVALLARQGSRLDRSEEACETNLDDLLDDDFAQDLEAGDVVAARDLLWGVEAVLREDVEDVDDVEV